MRKLKCALLAVLAIFAAVPAAVADGEQGPYIGLGFGLHEAGNSTVSAEIPAGSPAVQNRVTFDTGWGAIGTIGYKWPQSFRTEFELGYRNATVGDVAGAPWLGRQSAVTLMGNILYDVGVGTAFQPYVGGGAGLAITKWSDVRAAGTPVFSDRSSKFQWQGIVGVTVPLRDRIDAFVDYRYANSLNNRFNSDPTGSLVSGHDDASHNVFLGLRFTFGGKSAPQAAAEPPPPPPPAPAPEPAPAPKAEAPPPPPPVPQNFLVFFDFDKSNLRPDAEKIVMEAADHAKQTGKSTISVTGHTDTSGPAAYNLALSERRALAVKSALMEQGFSDREIAVMFKGESEPLVATGDGVKEPQNRRVEIVME